MGKVGVAPTQVVAAQLKFVRDKVYKNLGKVGAAPTQVVAGQLEWCTPTHSRELAQVTSRDVPSRELAPNNNIFIFFKTFYLAIASNYFLHKIP